MVRLSGSSLPCFRRELLAVPNRAPKDSHFHRFLLHGCRDYYLVTYQPIFSPSNFLHGLILSLHVFGREQIVKKKPKRRDQPFSRALLYRPGSLTFTNPIFFLPFASMLPFHLVFPWEDCVSQTQIPTFAVLSTLITLLPEKLQLWRKWSHLFFSSEGDFASLDLEVV